MLTIIFVGPLFIYDIFLALVYPASVAAITTDSECLGSDRRPFNGGALGEREDGEAGECILWVDGTEGLVRSMDVIPETSGMETVVRTLIRAMEMPRSPAPPCRPKKIVVRNRELQFLLRGILQDLDINVEYQAQLPLIDELFRTFDSIDDRRPAPIPPPFDAPLKKLAREIWHLAPGKC
ncbi:DUF6930 domain-containing protein [Synechocystis salina]|uniref:DUF6930 domain-containing protein n=1 Tax=Synechocystis salina TaxID=945780 RepID=UPI001D140B49|nr:hypothetical protein [Synechocystis salina]